jgi:hypothetical protein
MGRKHIVDHHRSKAVPAIWKPTRPGGGERRVAEKRPLKKQRVIRTDDPEEGQQDLQDPDPMQHELTFEEQEEALENLRGLEVPKKSGKVKFNRISSFVFVLTCAVPKRLPP